MAAPAAPPLALSIRQLNATSVLAQWLPPPSTQRNGNITAYQVRIIRLISFVLTSWNLHSKFIFYLLYFFVQNKIINIIIFLFQISVTLEGTSPSMLLANLTIPASPTSVVIGGLVTDATYSIRAAAWTLMGLGPPSPSTIHRMEALPLSTTKISPALSPPPVSKQPNNVNNSDSDSSGSLSGMTLMVQETWFILLLGGILLAILCLLVAALVVRRNLAKRKALSALSKTDADSAHCMRNGTGGANNGGGQVAGSVRGRDAFWSRSWSTTVTGNNKEAEMDAQTTLLPHASPASVQMTNRPLVAPPEYAELLGHSTNPSDHHHHLELQQQQAQLSLSSFLPRRNMTNHPAAYATTTLVNQRNNLQQQQQHPQQHGFSNPYSGSCAAFSASDSSGYTTDELGERNLRGLPSGGRSSRSRQGSNNNVVKLLPIPNLGEMFPPPPRHPPPSSPLLGGVDRQKNEVIYLL